MATLYESDRLIGMSELVTLTGLGRSTLYRHVAAGTFPAPVMAAPKARRWRLSDVQQWIAALTPAPDA